MKKSVSLLLALVISSSAMFSVKADELTDAQKKLDNINNSINDKKSTLNGINKEKENIEQSLKQVEEKLKTASGTLNQLNAKVFDLDKQIKSLEKKILENTENLNEQNEMLSKRLKSMYINGNESYLDLLLEANSFSDFITRIDSIVKIVEYDNNLLKSIEANKKTLETQKTDVEKKKKETADLKVQAEGRKKELEATAKEKKVLMDKAVSDKASYEKLIKAEEELLKKQSDTIASMINRINEEAKAKEDANKDKDKNTDTDKDKDTDEGEDDKGEKTDPETPEVSSAIGKLHCVTGTKTYITSYYGWRFHPVLKYQRFHAGIDIGVFSGTSIYSLADGEVIYAGWMSGYGNVVMIDHGSLTSVYAHNSSLVAEQGQKVKGGQLISYSGNTGVSSGPHLHFEIRNVSGQTIDPISYYVK